MFTPRTWQVAVAAAFIAVVIGVVGSRAFAGLGDPRGIYLLIFGISFLFLSNREDAYEVAGGGVSLLILLVLLFPMSSYLDVGTVVAANGGGDIVLANGGLALNLFLIVGLIAATVAGGISYRC